MEKLLVWGLTTLIGAFVGSFLAGYLNEKGKNIATHEDLDKLVEQMKAVTKATKEIEAKITDEVWNRQKQWELKRDVLFEAAKRLAEAEEALLSFATIIAMDNKYDANDMGWWEEKGESSNRWAKASAALDESRLFVGIVCDEETTVAIDKFGKLTNRVFGDLHKKVTDAYSNSQYDLVKTLFLARLAIRKELGINTPTNL